MTFKNRIRKLEERGEQKHVGERTRAEWIHAERMRLLHDPEAVERIRQEALREDQEQLAAEKGRGPVGRH